MFSRWWKMIIGVTAAVAIITALLVAARPKEYVATVTALPANSIASDKGHLFARNINQLYPTIGLPEELDPVLGTGTLDTLYIALSEAHNLAAHYKLNENDGNALYHAAAKLKANASIVRNEFGALKIRIWDRSPEMAAVLANGYFTRLQALHQYLQNQSNAIALQKLVDAQKGLNGTDSLGAAATTGASSEQFNQLINEYRLQLAANPPALLKVEGARPPLFPDRPKPVPALLLALFLAFIFSLLLAVFLESRSPRKI